MLGFVVIASKSDRPVELEYLLRVDDPDPPELHFGPDEYLRWSNKSGTVHFFGWQAFTEIAQIRSHWHIDRSGLTGFTGHLWPRETGWTSENQSWASQLSLYLAKRDVVESHEDLFGLYSIVSLPDAGRGYVVTDLFGAGVTFVAEIEDTLVISSRSGLAAKAITPRGQAPQRDVLGAGWLLFWGGAFGEDTGYRQVSRLPFNCYVEMEPLNGAKVQRRKRPHWQFPNHAEIGSSHEDLLPLLETDLRSTLKAVAALPVNDLDLKLSGGKDSRLLLAVLLGEGLANRFKFTTFGTPDMSDVRVAGRIARHFDLNWHFEDRSTPRAEQEEEKLGIHTFQVEALTNSWDASGSLTVDNGITISGVSGEFFRYVGFSAAGLTTKSAEELIAVIRARREWDSIHLLRNEAREYYLSTVEDWIRFHVENGEEIQRITSFVMQTNKTMSTTGTSRAVKSRLWVNPFLTPVCVRVNQYIPVSKRTSARFHLDLMRSCSILLSKIPLATERWSEETFGHLPDAEDYRAIKAVVANSRIPMSAHVTRFSANRPFIESYLLDRANPIFEIADRSAVERALRKTPMDPLTLQKLYGALTAAIWLSRNERPAKISRDARPPI